MNKILERIRLHGILPIATIKNPEHAETLAELLSKHCLPLLEITLRTDLAPKAMEKIAAKSGNFLLGAGTVLSIDDVKKGVDSGAKFFVTPGFSKNVIEYCAANSLPVIPGVITPTEIQTARDCGIDVLKLFPIQVFGGYAYLSTVSAPYGKVKFIPTGGIDHTNLLNYLRHNNVAACGGSWMLKPELIEAGAFKKISEAIADSVNIMHGFTVNLHRKNKKDEKKIVKILETSLDIKTAIKQDQKRIDKNWKNRLMESAAENCVNLLTNFIDRSVCYFELKGISADNEMKTEKNGKLYSVFLNYKINSLPVRLVQI
jgi:2-dehydro-3-deoxyphosphogluconate aldolase/(4S)-4-hydroxy-2-oxoglutarate aldolase